MRRSVRFRLVAAAFATVLVAVLASGCTTAQTAQTGAAGSADSSGMPYLANASSARLTGGTLNMQVLSDIDEASGLDPQLSSYGVSWQLESLVYDTLVGMSPTLKPQPQLAASWDTPDPRTYIFHLRPGAAFSNGRPVTADDVVGSLKRVTDPKVGAFWSVQLGPISSITKVDDTSVKVSLSRPYTPFLAALANINAAIVPIKEMADHTVDISKTMLGTGPYMVKAHTQDVSWTLVKNPHYWRADEPHFDTIKIVISPEEPTRVAALRNGSAGLASMTSVDASRFLNGVTNVQVGVQHTTDFWYMLVNSQGAGSKLRDQRVREAINIAIDRKQIARTAMGGLAAPSADSPAAFGVCDPATLPSATAGLEHARQLLKQAHQTHLTFSFTTANSDPQEVAIAQVMQQQLRRIGVTMVIKNIDDGAFYTDVDVTHHFDAALSWFAGYGDPAMVLQWWKPGVLAATKGVIKNDPRLIGLIDAAQQSTGARRNADIRAMCTRADQNADLVALVTKPAVLAWRTDEVHPTLYSTEGYSDLWRDIALYRRGGS